MRSPSDGEAIFEALRDEAVYAGIIDTEFIRLVDTSAVWIDVDGRVHGASAAIASLHRRCPAIFIDDPQKFGSLGIT